MCRRRLQAAQELFQIIGQRRREMQFVPAVIRKCDGLRVQKQPPQAQLFGLPISFVVAVSFIAGQWMTHTVQMRTNLVGTTRLR